MEQPGTNSIAEKLDSLEIFPAGYTPNLDSKWALLERSREGERRVKRRGYLWLRAAASVVVCYLAFLLWPGAETKLSALEKKSVKKTTQISISKHQEIPQLLLNSPEASRHNPEEKTSSSMQVSPAEQQQEVAVTTAPIKDSAAKETESLQELATELTPSKKKKARYVQMDFGEPDREQKVPTNFYTHTQFKLFNSDRENQEKQSHTTSSTAHLRINL